MARKYTHIKVLEKEILELKSQGRTHREIATEHGLELKQVKKFFERHNRRVRQIEAGITPRKQGRPSKGYKVAEQEKDYEIKRLKMENELLRDFLRLAGRR